MDGWMDVCMYVCMYACMYVGRDYVCETGFLPSFIYELMTYSTNWDVLVVHVLYTCCTRVVHVL